MPSSTAAFASSSNQSGWPAPACAPRGAARRTLDGSALTMRGASSTGSALTRDNAVREGIVIARRAVEPPDVRRAEESG